MLRKESCCRKWNYYRARDGWGTLCVAIDNVNRYHGESEEEEGETRRLLPVNSEQTQDVNCRYAFLVGRTTPRRGGESWSAHLGRCAAADWHCLPCYRK